MSENSTTLKGASPAPSKFTVWELELASAMGLTKEEIREIRQKNLAENTHWVKGKKRVLYSPEGVQALAAAVKVTPPALKTPATPEAEPAAHMAIETVTLKVFRSGLKNDRIIEAYAPDKDPEDVRNRVRVRVRCDKNFIKGMEIPTFKLQDGLYELARACPRSRGKW